MLWLLLIVTAIAVSYVKFHLYKKRLLKYVGHLPTANDFPLLGIGYRFIGKSTSEIFNQLVDISTCVPNPSRYWFGPTLLIVVGNPEDMQTVLNSPHCYQKPYVYKFIPVPMGLFALEAHLWKPIRKLLNPTLNHKILMSFIPVFNEKSKIMADTLTKMVGQKDPFDISKQFFACTLDMVCATTLGANYGFQTENKNIDFLESMELCSEVVAERIVKLWLHWDFIFKWSSLHKIFAKLFETVKRLPNEIIRTKQEEFKQSNQITKKNSEDSDDFKEPQIFVNELLRLQSAGLFDDSMILDNTITMIAGGNETCALTASHVILLLAMYQDIQEKVFQEIKSVHSTQYSDTDAEAMTKLNYLEMVIRETMRLFPVGPFLGRESHENVKISNCTIPKGTLILLAFHTLHRDKSVWGPNPEKFNPDNFLPEKVAQRHPYSYLPFSGGPRNCIGIKYAWLSMKVMLSALLRRYKFTTDAKFEDITVKWDVTLKIVNRHFVRIEPRVY